MGLNAVQSYPAERVLVAALLGRPASFHELGGRVTEEMFTEPGLRLVFRAFAELASRGERIDMATVEAEMFRLDHRLYGELNGVSFLSAMLPGGAQRQPHPRICASGTARMDVARLCGEPEQTRPGGAAAGCRRDEAPRRCHRRHGRLA